MLRRSVALLLLALGLAAVPGPADAAPQPESALAGVVQVTTGGSHACALLDTGQVRCWGADNVGQLGDGGKTAGPVRSEPVTVLGVTGVRPLSGVTQISAGQFHTCAALQTTRTVCWGINVDGQLGDGSTILGRSRPVFVRNLDTTDPQLDIVQVDAASSHTCAVLTNGQARCWGDNTFGQLANPVASFPYPRVVRNGKGTGPLMGVEQISTARDHTCAVVGGGQLRCWGQNGSGQLGDGTTEHRSLPIVVLGVTGQTLTGVTQVGLGTATSCARRASGRAVCWGSGSGGSLGDGTDDDSLRPTVVADTAGDDDLLDVGAVNFGETHGCALLASRQMRCWGNNLQGQLGNGTEDESFFPVVTLNPVGTAALRNVAQFDTGSSITCAALLNGQARCWGEGNSGQLGNGDLEERHLPVVVHLS